MNNIEEKLKMIPNLDLQKFKKQETKRTTFNILKFANDSLEKLSKDSKFQHKQIFDSVILNEGLLKVVIEISKNYQDKNSEEDTILKTLLISTASIKKLNEISKTEKLKRDILASYIIFIVEKLSLQSIENEKEAFREGGKIVAEAWSYLEDVEKKLTEKLGEDHPITQAFGHVIVTCMNLNTEIDAFLYKNKPFNPDSF